MISLHIQYTHHAFTDINFPKTYMVAHVNALILEYNSVSVVN